MKHRKFALIIAIASLFLMSLSGQALAGFGCPGHAKGQGKGESTGLGGPKAGCMGPGKAWAKLTPEQKEKLEAERKTFRDSTSDLRVKIQQKQLDLKKELLNKEPSVRKAKDIQKDISGLEAELAQKRIVHRIKMKEIAPELPMGHGMGFGRGHGKGRGHCPR